MIYNTNMELFENTTGKKACYKTDVRVYKTIKNIVFKFRANTSKFNSYSNKYNDKLYLGDVCEIFIKYGKENHYYEIEVAPNGATFLSDITNINNKFSGELIDPCFIKTSSKCKKDCYKVKIVIPKKFIKTKKIEFNAFRIDTDGTTPEKHLFALHPTLCRTFHRIEFIK